MPTPEELRKQLSKIQLPQMEVEDVTNKAVQEVSKRAPDASAQDVQSVAPAVETAFTAVATGGKPPEKVEEAKMIAGEKPEGDMTKQQMLYSAIIGVAPALIGYALGGNQGGAVGAAAGAKGLEAMEKREKEIRDLKKEESKLKREELKEKRKEDATESRFVRGQEGSEKRARIMAGLQDKKTAREEQKYQETANVPEYKLKPGFRPQETEIKSFREQKTTVDDIARLSKELEDMISKHGGKVIPSKERALMTSKKQELSTKIRKAADLGVPNAQDAVITDETIGDVTNFLKLVEGGGARATGAKLNQFRKSTRAGLDIQAGNMGYERSGGAAIPAPFGERVMQNGHEYIWNEETGEYE